MQSDQISNFCDQIWWYLYRNFTLGQFLQKLFELGLLIFDRIVDDQRSGLLDVEVGHIEFHQI